MNVKTKIIVYGSIVVVVLFIGIFSGCQYATSKISNTYQQRIYELEKRAQENNKLIQKHTNTITETKLAVTELEQINKRLQQNYINIERISDDERIDLKHIENAIERTRQIFNTVDQRIENSTK